MAIDSLSSGRASLFAYVQRLSFRERLLVGSLVLVALVLAPLKAYDWSQGQQAALVDAKSSLQTLRSQDDALQMRRLSDRLEAQGRQARNWAWSAPSFPVARVMLETQLATAAVQAGMVMPDVKSSEQPEVAGGLKFARVELDGPFTWPSFEQLVKRLSTQGKGFVVESLSAENDGTGPRLRFVVLMPVVINDRASALGRRTL